MDFEDILCDLEAATEGFNTKVRSDYKSLSKRVSNSTKAAKSAMKSGRYQEAIKHCDDAISVLTEFKNELESSGGETKDVAIGNAMIAAKTMAKAVLGTLGVLSALKIGSKVIESDMMYASEAKTEKFGLDPDVAKKADRKSKDDLEDIKYIFVDSLDVDPTFRRYERDFDYCKDKGVFEKNRELTPFTKDKSKWNEDYWVKLKRDFEKNPSAERIEHMRDVAKVFLAEKIDRIERERKDATNQSSRKPQAPEKPQAMIEQEERDRVQAEIKARIEKESAERRKYLSQKDDIEEKKATRNVVVTNEPRSSKGILSAKNIALVTAGAGVASALGSFIKNMHSGKNANVTTIIKGIDLSIKSLESIKVQCQEAMKVTETYVSTYDSFLIGVSGELFQNDSILESLVNYGFSDHEAVDLCLDIL